MAAKGERGSFLFSLRGPLLGVASTAYANRNGIPASRAYNSNAIGLGRKRYGPEIAGSTGRELGHRGPRREGIGIPKPGSEN